MDKTKQEVDENQSKHKLTPKLRFPEFREAGAWEEKKLGEVAAFTKGKGISKSDILPNGSLPCIRYGELYTHYNETINSIISFTNTAPDNLVLSQEDDVIIPSSGETKEDIATASCVLKSGIALGGDLNIIRSKLNGIFLSYYLNNAKKQEIARLAQGISVIHLYLSQLKKLNINIPKPKEQQKIAACLSSLDELIEMQEQKLEALKKHKKGLIQQLFPAEGETTPKLRFPEFQKAGAWEVKKLGEMCKIAKSGGTPTSTNKNYYNGYIPFLTIGDITSQGKYLKHTSKTISQSGIDNSASWIVPINTIIYSMYASVGFVSINKIPLATSQAVINLILKKNIDVEFIYYYLLYYKQYIYKYIETGTQGNLNSKIVKSLKFHLPSLPEQQKIAACLSSLDELIEMQEQKLKTLKKHKKGLMQQLFP